MKIKLINFGGKAPVRAHYNDAGADVFVKEETILKPHSITKIPLGIGLELPDGFVAFILPRSGMASKNGITTEVVPIDSGYKGEIHAIAYNANNREVIIGKDIRIGQLVIVPTILAEFSFDTGKERGTNGFGSTGGYN